MALDRTRIDQEIANLKNMTPEERKETAQAALAHGKSFLQKPLPNALNTRQALLLVVLVSSVFGGIFLKAIVSLIIFVAVVAAIGGAVYFLTKRNRQS